MKHTRKLTFLYLVLFLVGALSMPVGVSQTQARLQEAIAIETNQNEKMLSSGPIDREIRVAVYYEDNTTLPDYATGLGMAFSNQVTPIINHIMSLAEVADLDTLTTQEILNHQLTTAEYDVFVIVDNYPRENITNYVKEFWLGGGGILAFNAAFGYLCWDGIIIPESTGDDGYGLLWDEETWSNHTVLERHPITKNLQVGDRIIEPSESEKEMFNGAYIRDNSVVGPYLSLVANQTDGLQISSILALDNDYQGGRVVALSVDLSLSSSYVKDVITESIDWLTPRPKGRILYDLSHYPEYGVDLWDGMYADQSSLHTELREEYVTREYTFDKLYPSANGNLTASNLADYDMLILNGPGLNFTSAEVTAVNEWVQAGGGLCVIGDHLGIGPPLYNLNYLLTNAGIEFNTTTNGDNSLTPVGMHETHEGCSTMSASAPGFLHLSSGATAIWEDSSNRAIIAVQEMSLGRIIAIADGAIVRNGRLPITDNLQATVNFANWLTAGDVLYYTTEPDSQNYYRTPGALALNDLDVDYYLTFDDSFMNLSLNIETWGLVILDGPYYTMDTYYDDIFEYVEAGGKLIMSEYYHESDASHPLWAALGFEVKTEIANQRPVHIWDDTHPILNQPNDYQAMNFTPTRDYGTEGVVLHVFSNATSLAGNSTNLEANESLIVLRNDGQTLFNSYLIDQFQGDTDDSTYMDAFELWENEIAFMLRPTIDSPASIGREAGTPASITWNPSSDRPYRFIIHLNNSEIEDYPWDGGPITYDADLHPPGLYNLNVTVYDTAGYSATDFAYILIYDTTYPAFVDGPDNLMYQEGTTVHLLNWSFNELYPDHYTLYINDSEDQGGPWDGSEISVDVGGLSQGVYNVTLAVTDTSGNTATSSVTLTVTEAPVTTTTTTTTTTTPTTTTGPGTTTPPPDDGTTLVIIVAIAGAAGVIIIIIIVMMKRKTE